MQSECPIPLKVRLVDGTLDVHVRLLRVSDSTIRISVASGYIYTGYIYAYGRIRNPQLARGEEGEWAGGPIPFMWQLTRCFSAVAELLLWPIPRMFFAHGS